MMSPKWVTLYATFVSLALLAVAGCDAPCPTDTSSSASSSGSGQDFPGGTGSGGFDAQAFPDCAPYVSTHLRGTLNGFIFDEWFDDDKVTKEPSVPSYARIELYRYDNKDALTDSRIDLKWDGSIKLDDDHWAPLIGLMLLPDDLTIYRFKPGSKLFRADEYTYLYELVMNEGHLFGCSK